MTMNLEELTWVLPIPCEGLNFETNDDKVPSFRYICNSEPASDSHPRKSWLSARYHQIRAKRRSLFRRLVTRAASEGSTVVVIKEPIGSVKSILRLVLKYRKKELFIGGKLVQHGPPARRSHTSHHEEPEVIQVPGCQPTSKMPPLEEDPDQFFFEFLDKSTDHEKKMYQSILARVTIY